MRRAATHNARTAGGVMVVEGAQVVVGDVDQVTPDEESATRCCAGATTGGG